MENTSARTNEESMQERGDERNGEKRGARPDEQLVHELFERQVELTPHEVALEFERQSITYHELNCRSNQLARSILSRRLTNGHLIGICMDRSVEMVVALLSVIKAGCAYLPIDPTYPTERLRFMVEDAAPAIVLTQEDLKLALPFEVETQVLLEKEHSRYSMGNLSRHETGAGIGKSLLYVIYTSGSTGRPKGVAMNHAPMVNLIEWHRSVLPHKKGTRVLQFAALSFDVAFQEIMSTLCTGGTLVLINEWMRRDPGALATFLRRRAIQKIFLPPLMLQSVAEALVTSDVAPSHLRDVITAGEQLRVTAAVRRMFKSIDGCRLHNHYGPTESHVVTYLTLSGDPEHWPDLPAIGQPISGAEVYVLDEYRRPVSNGACGEIYIGGDCVALGYLNRPKLTAERFIASPFGVEGRTRMYKTGDRGRWLGSGILEFMGRNDDQVKIRGQRVELGEIEAQLASHENVREAAVCLREDSLGTKRLVAYIVVRRSETNFTETLRDHLGERLPAHMVPSVFMFLSNLPVTSSGKLDRQALPVPDADSDIGTTALEPPQGEAELLLSEIWRDLLGLRRVSRRDRLFELGGDSFYVAQMMQRLRLAGFSVDVRRIFDNLTLKDLAIELRREEVQWSAEAENRIPLGCQSITNEMLALVDLAPEHIQLVEDSVEGGAPNVQDVYPLVPMQEGILFHHILQSNRGDTYVLPCLFAFAGQRHLDDFIRALRQVIDRHDALRTAVLWEGLPRPLQVVWRQASVTFERIVLDPDQDIVAQLQERMRPETLQLDLRKAPMMRLEVAKDPNTDSHFALLQLHHLLCDHQSLETLFEELQDCLNGRSWELPQPIPYRRHVADVLTRARAEAAETFFRSKLADIDQPTAPFGLVDVHGSGDQLNLISEVLDPALGRSIRARSRILGVSPATVFHAAWALVLARTSGRDDVVFGTLLMGRLQSRQMLEHTFGMFMNTLPVRLKLKALGCEELIRTTHSELGDLITHEHAPLAMAMQVCDMQGGAPLFSALLNYRHSSRPIETEQIELAPGIRLLEMREWTNYPITLSIDDFGTGFTMTAKADGGIEPSRVLAYVKTALAALTAALSETPDRPVMALNVAPESETHALIAKLNAKGRQPLLEDLVHRVFERTAERRADEKAVVCGEFALTFSELNKRANQLARYLTEKGAGPDQLVGLYVERSVEMMVGLLAALKSGAGYLPLDISYPQERINYMVGDARPKLLLVQRHLKSRVRDAGPHVISLDEDWPEISKRDSANLVSTGENGTNLAYVIYTSGSTGRPKGVMVEHRNVVSLWSSLEEIYRSAGECQNVALNGSFTFDASIKQIVQLLSGRTIFVITEEMRADPAAMLGYIRSTEVHCIDCTPSQLATWVSEGLLDQKEGPLRMVLIGGEAIEPSLWKRLSNCEGLRFYNLYGPTECTVDATFGYLDADTNPHIGRPMEDKRVYILDGYRRPVPIGVSGEIAIGGAGVARGYLNMPGLTAERFIADPFSDRPHARMYTTGDVGAWQADGSIRYQGRIDHQVKIRGYRIELGEIESIIAQHAQVGDVRVIAREDIPRGSRIVAYMTVRDGTILDTKELRQRLRATLPEVMIPSAFVVLKKFPLTRNGKLDRASLPAPYLASNASSVQEPPRGEVEHVLAEVWRELLHVEKVGREDNFFDLGGHSLLAMQVIVRVRSQLSIKLPMRSLFDLPTLRQLASNIEGIRQAQLEASMEHNEGEMAGLLERVSAMNDGEVRELMRQLKTEPLP